ncbi:hypothetical protein Leryth_005713 [Lithospermum erythrorhizon]|nr:hypothetical protein Leryth_005713 [Lithospermum erythrorhizon]
MFSFFSISLSLSLSTRNAESSFTIAFWKREPQPLVPALAAALLISSTPPKIDLCFAARLSISIRRAPLSFSSYDFLLSVRSTSSETVIRLSPALQFTHRYEADGAFTDSLSSDNVGREALTLSAEELGLIAKCSKEKDTEERSDMELAAKDSVGPENTLLYLKEDLMISLGLCDISVLLYISSTSCLGSLSNGSTMLLWLLLILGDSDNIGPSRIVG